VDRRESRATSRKFGSQPGELDKVGILAQEDGGQGALLGRNEQGLWTDLIHPGLRPSQKRGEAQPSPGTARRKGSEAIRKPARKLDIVGDLAQEDGGQGALLGRNEQG